jgi:hypothetical protein
MRSAGFARRSAFLPVLRVNIVVTWHDDFVGEHMPNRDRTRTPLAALVALVWTFTVVMGQFTGEWLGAQIVTPVMISVVFYYFGSEIADRLRGRGANGNGAKA